MSGISAEAEAALKEIRPDFELCPRCRCCETEWMQCEQCNGEGETEPGDLHDLDPLWYGLDETEPCGLCLGDAAWQVCGGRCDELGQHARVASTGRERECPADDHSEATGGRGGG